MNYIKSWRRNLGYITLIAVCFRCQKTFSSNPDLTPHLRFQGGERQPICEPCMQEANRQRVAWGLEPFNYPKNAYEPKNEDEGYI